MKQHRLVICLLAMTCLMLVSPIDAKEPVPKTSPQFGINPSGITSPEMRAALNRLQEAGVIEGRRGSLTFFRWTADDPPKLAHLGLWGKQIDNELVALTSHMPDLAYVSLYETGVDDRGIASLAQLPKLRSLAISPVCRYEKAGFGPPQWSYPFLAEWSDRPRIGAIGLASFARVATLENVNLLDAQLESADLAMLASWPKLSSLGLPCAVDAEVVRHLQSCPKLKDLTLGYRAVTADELTQLAQWKALRKLTLIHAHLDDSALAALAKLPTVEEIELEDGGLTDERLMHLAPSPRLATLTLSRNEIAGPGVSHLVKLRLKVLGLEFNNLDDSALEHLTQLTSVEDLRLAYCRGITDRGIQSGILQGMTHLKRLNLRGLKQVTDASLDSLARCPHLDHVGIRETAISRDGVQRMQRAMPKTTVFK